MNKVTFYKIILIFLLNLSSYSAYEASIYLSSGSKLFSENITIFNNKLIYDQSKNPISLDYIERVEFKFKNFNNDICSSLFKRNKLVALESLLEELKIFSKFSKIESNLPLYFNWLLKSQIWNNNYLEALESIKYLKDTNSKSNYLIAELYLIYILLEKNEIDDAYNKFNKVKISDGELIKPMYNYLKARVYFNKKQYSDALSYLANVVAYYSHNSEWMAPTLLLEAETYLLIKKREKAFNIVQEIKWIYPNSYWSNKADALLEY